jgi:hypothetical protein
MSWRIREPQNIPQGIQETLTTQQVPLGTIVRAFSGTYGEGEFIYLLGVASEVVGDLVTYNGLTGQVTRGAAAAGTGFPLAVAMSANVAGQFGWYQISGNAVINNNGTQAVDSAVFQKATAQTGSAAVAGTQMLNAVTRTANNSTFTKTCTTRNGSTALIVPDFDGLYIGAGLVLSGTGIAGGTTIAAGINGAPQNGNNSVILSAAATADGTVTVTFTRTNQSVVTMQRPFGQGQII